MVQTENFTYPIYSSMSLNERKTYMRLFESTENQFVGFN